jgi:hypothetical protein
MGAQHAVSTIFLAFWRVLRSPAKGIERIHNHYPPLAMARLDLYQKYAANGMNHRVPQ